MRVKPIHFSQYHRTVIMSPRIQMFAICGSNLSLMEKHETLSVEKYWNNVDIFINGRESAPQGFPIVQEDIPIIGKFLTREYGDGINDSVLGQVIVETIPRKEWLNYYYPTATYKDPKVKVELRNAAWVERRNSGVMALGYTYELVAINQAAQGSANVWFSYAHGVSDPTADVNLRKIAYEPDVTEEFPSSVSAQGQVWRESIKLNAPINSRYRRMRIEFESRLTQVIRSVRVMASTFRRRS